MTAQELIASAVAEHGDRFAIVTSFQLEGMVLLDMAARIEPAVRVITVDTGRLPSETFDIIDAVRARYGIAVETVLPDPAEVESMVVRFGANGFRESVPQRTLCCQIRKVRPLERKLESVDAYAVGLRREQNETRGNIQQVENVNGKRKLSPLADWTREDVERYATENSVLRHALYDRGYRSIGCAPCTRAVSAEESERAGRWWWEEGAAKECGLHFSPDGRAERTVDVLLREVLAAARK